MPLTASIEIRELLLDSGVLLIETGVLCCQAVALTLPTRDNNCALINLDGAVVVPGGAQSEAFSTLSTVQGDQLCRGRGVKATDEKQLATWGDRAGVPSPAVDGAGPRLPAIRSQDVTRVGKADKDDSVDQVERGAIGHVPGEDLQITLGLLRL